MLALASKMTLRGLKRFALPCVGAVIMFAGCGGRSHEFREGGGAGAGEGGAPLCVGGEAPLLCDGKCVDSNQDDANCGRCDHACTGAATCGGGDCTVCATGCAVLTASFDSSQETAVWQIPIKPAISVTSSDEVSLRIYSASGGENVTAFAALGFQSGNSSGQIIGLSTTGWQVKTWNVPQAEQLVLIEIEVYSNTGPWAAETVIYVDSITSPTSSAIGPFEFSTSAAPLAVYPGSDATPMLSWRGP